MKGLRGLITSCAEVRLSTLDILKWGLPLTALALVVSTSLPGAAASTSPVSKQSSSSIAIASDGTTLLVVNSDSNSLTLVDTGTGLATAEIVVGVDPRAVAVSPDDARAYVVNQGSDSFAIIDLATQDIAQIAVGDRPAGVAVSLDGLCWRKSRPFDWLTALVRPEMS